MGSKSLGQQQLSIQDALFNLQLIEWTEARMGTRVYKIYALVDPREEYQVDRYTIERVAGVRYIGQTFNSLAHRFRGHLSEKDSNAYKVRWIQKLQRLGMEPSIHLLSEHRSFEEVDAEEIRLIALARSKMGKECLNLTDGGQGGYYSEELVADLQARGLPGNSPYHILRLAITDPDVHALVMESGRTHLPQIGYTVERSTLRQLSTIKCATEAYRQAYEAALLGLPFRKEHKDRGQAGYLHGLLFLAGYAEELEEP